jgi:Tfp pilus assembly protein PilN
MINLLPPAIKTANRYARYNAVMVRYIALAVTVLVVLAGAQLGSRYYLNQRIKTTSDHITTTQQQIDTYHSVQTQAATLNTRLAAIQTIQKNQAQFSTLLSDLAKYMPVGTSISSITLTGDDKQPVRLSVNAADYKTALGFRDSIAHSPRISAADIETVGAAATGTTTSFNVTVVFAFHPGAAK